MNYRIFVNPQPQQLKTFIEGVSQLLGLNAKTIPYDRAFAEKEGAYLDHFSRMALGWTHSREGYQLIIRVLWL